MEYKKEENGSWITENETVVYKRSDKTFFEYNRTTVSVKIRWFFDTESLEKGNKKDIVLIYDGREYKNCYISRTEKRENLAILYWDASLAKKLQKYKPQSDNEETYPVVKFTKTAKDQYILEVKTDSESDTDKIGVSNEYQPSLEEYNPQITAEQYEQILSDTNLVKRSWLDTVYYLYKMGGEATCKQIANRYGNGAPHYNTNAINTAKAVHKATNCALNVRETGRNRYWPVLFVGRNMPEGSEGAYCYKLREPLMKAIKALEEKGIFQNMNQADKVEYDKNLILYGPPGTGKTYNSKIYAVAICDGKSINELTDYDAVSERYEQLKEEHRVAFTTFHQSYGYEEFIEGIKPVADEGKRELGYTIEPGLFKKFCDTACTDPQPYVFIIDEINRGNISKIFGELITLIEDTKREGMPEEMSAILPYSGKPFSVPENVYILGTMNTADRSIALMDTALRRRFQFIEMLPDTNVLRKIKADKVGDLDIVQMLEKINERILFLYDREHTIGHAFFTGLRGENATVEKLGAIFEKSIIPLLQEYFYEDYQKIQLVLGDNAKSNPDFKFILDEKIAVRDIFKGSVENVIDLPEKKYSMNKAALKNIESYKEIL